MQKKLSRRDIIKALNIMFASPLRLINFLACLVFIINSIFTMGTIISTVYAGFSLIFWNEWRKQVEKAMEDMENND